ncbi:DUF6430 domain-containing protein [Thalassospira sp. MA62]|nr:DUF6430 domain-containing protein [Thalassospira sp. MA62]
MRKIISILKNKKFWKESWGVPAILFGIGTTTLTFVKSLEDCGVMIFSSIIIFTIIYYLFRIYKIMKLSEITLDIDGSNIKIMAGDLFDFPSSVYKVIAFNEFFDTCVDDKLISSYSLNGKYIKKKYSSESELLSLDNKIEKDSRLNEKIIERDVIRKHGGKTIRYKLGTILKDDDYFLVAFSRFDEDNSAYLRLQDYANCLIEFWNEVNVLYAQNKVVVPIMGSGITRRQEFSDATKQQLLEIMIWTFKISKVKFREPADITIVFNDSDLEEFNFYRLREFEENLF